MTNPDPEVLRLLEGRFSRLDAIGWWDQSLLHDARILVVGAGALGNEVIKNLSLLGAGNLVVADMDRVELSNLSRSVLFRESDEGEPKAECAARAALEIFPDIVVTPIVGNVISELGLGYFRWAQVVIGAIDNREARVFINGACARVGTPWLDGGIEVLGGVARGFSPPGTACYECTMGQADWDQLNQRRSCSLLARRALSQGGTPTTPITASVIGAVLALEAVKLLHGMEALLGRGFHFDGQQHGSYTVTYPVKPDCCWHEGPIELESVPDLSADSTLSEVWNHAADSLDGLDALEFVRELVDTLTCPSCGASDIVFAHAETIGEELLRCPACDIERTPSFFHSLSRDDGRLAHSVSALGLPLWEIIWARKGEAWRGILLDGDADRALGATGNLPAGEP